MKNKIYWLIVRDNVFHFVLNLKIISFTKQIKEIKKNSKGFEQFFNIS